MENIIEYKINIKKLKNSLNINFYSFLITFIYSFSLIIYLKVEITNFYFLFALFGLIQTKILFKTINEIDNINKIITEHKYILFKKEDISNFYFISKFNIVNSIKLERILLLINFILSMFYISFLYKMLFEIKSENILMLISLPCLYLPSVFLFNRGCIEKIKNKNI